MFMMVKSDNIGNMVAIEDNTIIIARPGD